MADYRSKLEEWRETARRRARELDEKYNLRERVEESARAAQEAARRSADTFTAGTEGARAEAERLSNEYEVYTRRAAEEAARAASSAARAAQETVRHAGRAAGEKAGEAFDEARSYYDQASKVYSRGAKLTRATAAATIGLVQAGDWIRQNPQRAVVISLSVVAGVRLGAAFPKLDGVLLGSHPHWLTHSAFPAYALRRVGERFDSYLRERETLIANGQLTEAERSRVEFERKIVRYVGAPLLGSFACATGAALWAQILQPGRITGAPISWLLGGNPFLDGVWLFANGIICFQQGYKFFMIALADQQDVTRVMSELKGLLSAPLSTAPSSTQSI